MSERISEYRGVVIAAALRSCQMFAGARPEDIQAIADLVSIRALAKGEYLFREGEPSAGFYLVQKGTINVHRVNSSGKEQVIHMFRPGETFAEATLATDQGYPADARAAEASQVLLIQKAGFVELIKREPKIALRILAAMSVHLRVLVRQLEDLTLRDVESRLINWILQRCPQAATGPVTIEVKGTKRALAAELGTVGETFSRTLAKLRERGLIFVKGKTLTVLSPAGLVEFQRRQAGA
jgi:CRP-like cAMP-binding protein